MSTSSYIHGINPDEQQRLFILNEILNQRCLEKIRINPGERILDVGSGLGLMTALFAGLSGPEGFCLGIERSTEQLQKSATLLREGLSFRQGDALKLPLAPDEEESFDLVHARFILEHLPEPQKAIHEMKRALKPGGRIFLADDDHQAMILFPEPEGFQQLWTAYTDSFVEVGNDPFIGRKLPSLLMSAGFMDVRNDTVFFGDVAGSPTFEMFVKNLSEVISTAQDVMMENNLVSQSAYDSAMKSLSTWAKLSNATALYPLCLATGNKPLISK
jgi:ubiquinone/menaquinone biosynthesis C-methylase UbiE